MLPLQEVYKLLWNQCPDAQILTDAKARIDFVNPAVSKLFGIPEGELKGKNVLRLFSNRRGDPDRRTIPAQLEEHGELLDYETYVVRPGGLRLAVSLNVRRVMDERKRLVGYLGTVRDETRYIRRIYYDHLTGLGNLAAYQPALVGEVRDALKEKQPLALMWVDHDNFGLCNKRYGYKVCSNLLRASAALLMGRDCVPPLNSFYPRVFRYGGDEMPILLSKPESVCLHMAHEIRVNIANQRVPLKNGEHASTTASIGVAFLDQSLRRLEVEVAAELLEERAGQAVFVAKDRGRNRVVRWEPGLI